MAMQRDQFVTEICDVVGKSVSASAVSGALLQDRVKTYLNWAQKRMARHYSFHELNTNKETCVTVSDVKRYPLISGDNAFGLTNIKDIFSIRLIDSQNSKKLERRSARWFDWKFPRPENYSTGRPSLYIRYGNSVEFFRIPNAAYTLYIRYPRWAVDFANANSVSEFLNKDQLLLCAGVLETYLALEEYKDASIWLTRFKGMLIDAVHAEGDVDWEPQAEPYGGEGYSSGEPQYDPYGAPGDPLYGYSE